MSLKKKLKFSCKVFLKKLKTSQGRQQHIVRSSIYNLTRGKGPWNQFNRSER